MSRWIIAKHGVQYTTERWRGHTSANGYWCIWNQSDTLGLSMCCAWPTYEEAVEEFVTRHRNDEAPHYPLSAVRCG